MKCFRQGYMFEELSAGTFNVDAVAAGSTVRAILPHLNTKNSPDVVLKNSGKSFSLKSYATGKDSVIQQAKLDPDTRTASYHGQERVMPTDQIPEAGEVSHNRLLKNMISRPDVAKAYEETEKRLTDRITNEEGVSSRPVSRKELETIAKESKDQNFKAEDHGMSTSDAIKTEYLMKQAMKAGYTAAAITVALQLAPEIIKAIDFLVKNGELDVQQIKTVGMKGISSGAEGFLRGSVSAALYIKMESGALGKAFRGVEPTMLATVVALSMQTIKNSILVAAGKMKADEMGAIFTDSVIISGGYLIGAHIGGAIAQSILFELPVAGYLIGSLIGTSFCVMYNIGKNKLISFCADTGFTCFGLVDQDYELPKEILDDLGVEMVPIPRTDVETTDVERTEIVTSEIETAQYETIDIKVLRRGVIGVNKIGYVLQ